MNLDHNCAWTVCVPPCWTAVGCRSIDVLEQIRSIWSLLHTMRVWLVSFFSVQLHFFSIYVLSSHHLADWVFKSNRKNCMKRMNLQSMLASMCSHSNYSTEHHLHCSSSNHTISCTIQNKRWNSPQLKFIEKKDDLTFMFFLASTDSLYKSSTKMEQAQYGPFFVELEPGKNKNLSAYIIRLQHHLDPRQQWPPLWQPLCFYQGTHDS